MADLTRARPPAASRRRKWYPDPPGARRRQILQDVACVVTLLVLAFLAYRVHEAIQRLDSLTTAVSGAGTSVQAGFDSVAEAVDGVPLVGDTLGDALTSAGDRAGGELADLGERATTYVNQLAALTAAIVFAVPTLILVLTLLPARWRRSTEMTAAVVVLRGADEPERRRLIATRAALSLPYPLLLRHTGDPMGDLVAGRHDALVAAAMEHAGLAPGPRTDSLNPPATAGWQRPDG